MEIRMNKTDFVIAMGGSGVRAVHALLHLCAAGLCPNDLHILLLDTDSEKNGNTDDLLKLYGAYATMHKGRSKDQTLFSKKITLKTSCSLAKGYTTIKKIFDDLKAPEIGQTLLAKEELDELRVDKGAYGRPCVGALVFHKCMTDKPPTNLSTDFMDFFKSLLRYASDGSPANLMLMGSAFGGTGTTGLLLMRQFLMKQIKAHDPSRQDEQVLIRQSIRCATTILGPYFDVANDPNNDFRKNTHYVRCAMALRHYKEFEDSPSHLPAKTRYLISVPRAEQRPIRGEFAPEGENQKNWPHACDYIAAFACIEYFSDDKSIFQETEDRYWRYYQSKASDRKALFDRYNHLSGFASTASIFLKHFYSTLMVSDEEFDEESSSKKPLYNCLTWNIPWLTPKLRRGEQVPILIAMQFFLFDFNEWIELCGKEHKEENNSCVFLPKVLELEPLEKSIWTKCWLSAIKEPYDDWNELLQTIQENVFNILDEKKKDKNAKSHRSSISFLPQGNVPDYLKIHCDSRDWHECGIPSLFDQAWRCKYALKSGSKDNEMRNAWNDLLKLLARMNSSRTKITIERLYFWHQVEGLRKLLAADAPSSYHFDKEDYCHSSFWIIWMKHKGKADTEAVNKPVGFLFPDTIVVPSKLFMRLRKEREFSRQYLPKDDEALNGFKKAISQSQRISNGSKVTILRGEQQSWNPANATPLSEFPALEEQYLQSTNEIPDEVFDENNMLFSQLLHFYDYSGLEPPTGFANVHMVGGDRVAAIPLMKKEEYSDDAWQALLDSVRISYDSTNRQFGVRIQQLGKSSYREYTERFTAISSLREDLESINPIIMNDNWISWQSATGS
jgi:hypothetical protein